MTKEERRAFRIYLKSAGYKRQAHTEDLGNGVYVEFWNRNTNTVTVTWGPRSPA